MRTAEEIMSEIDDKWSYRMVLNIIKEAQREALEEAAKIAEKPDRLFERGETINLENQAGRIFASIRKLAEGIK